MLKIVVIVLVGGWVFLEGIKWLAKTYLEGRILRVLADEAAASASDGATGPRAGWLTCDEIADRIAPVRDWQALQRRRSSFAKALPLLARRGLVVSSIPRGGFMIEAEQLPERFCLSPDEARKRGVPAPSLSQTATA